MTELVATAEARALVARIAELEHEGADARDQVRSLLALQDGLAEIAVARSSDDVIARMLRVARESLGFSRGIFFSVDRACGTEARWQFDCGDPLLRGGVPALTNESAILGALHAERAQRVGRAHDLSAPLVDTRNWYVLSALSRGAGPLGILYLDGHPTREPREWDTRLVSVLASLAAVSIENGLLFERTERLATRDSLTGLYNRRAFSSKLDERIARSRTFRGELTYILIDVDDFKGVNDAHGHVHGDTVLRRVARTLTSCTRDDDVVGRYAGDEFVMLLSSDDAASGRSSVARVSAGLRAHGLRCSLGAAQFPSDAGDADGLLEAADRALYAAKAAGKNGFAFASDFG